MKQILIIIFIAILGSMLYAGTLRGISGNPKGSMIKNNLDQATKPFELSPERGRFLLTMSLAEDKSFALNNELANAAYPDVGYYKGRYYIYFAPGISLLALPFYEIGKMFNISQVASFASIAFFAILNLIVIFLIAKNIFKLSSSLSLTCALIFGFASTSWSYAITLYQHHVTTFFILSSFYAIWKYRQNKAFGWLWAFYTWLAFGLAISIDYPNAVFFIPNILYLLISSLQISKKGVNMINVKFRLAVIFTSVIFLFIVLLNGYYNYVNFGSPLRVSGSLTGAKTIQEHNLLNTSQGQKEIQQIQQTKEPLTFFHEETIPRSFSIMLFSRDRGLFLYSPIFMLGILGLYLLRKQINLEWGILIATALCILFLYSSWDDPWGGWAYGPRYLIPSMSILSLFIGLWLQNSKHNIIAGLITFILFAYSCAIALLGALTTNQVPPKVEADYLHMKYNFLLNLGYLKDSRSGSFFFNQFASAHMSLIQYFLIIYSVLMLIVFILLFIVPRFEKQ